MNRASFFVLMGILLLPSVVSQAYATGNLGHRGGCKLANDNNPADNSIECLKILKDNDNNPNIDYLEFDLWEVKDSGLIVIHGGNKVFGGRGYVFVGKHSTVELDSNLDKCTKWFGEECDKNLKLKQLTEEQAQELLLKDDYGQNPASLSKYVSKIEELQITKPILVDVKDIESGGAVNALFRELSRLKYQLSMNDLDKGMSAQGLAIWAGRKNRYRTEPELICDLSEKYNIGVYYKRSNEFCSR